MAFTNKQLVFFKRTLTVLFPIPVLIAASKLVSDNSFNILPQFYSLNVQPEPTNSPNNLFLKLQSQQKKMDDIEDFGSIIKTRNGTEIEQHNPFNPDIFSDDFGYKQAVVDDAVKNEQNEDNNLKFTKEKNTKEYVLFGSEFDNSSLKDKGDLHVLLEYSVEVDGKSLDFSSLISLYELLHSDNYHTKLLSVKKKQPVLSLVSAKNEGENTEYELDVKKDKSTKKLTFSLTGDLTIKNIYILFSNSPTLTPKLYFGENDNNDNTNLSVVKKGKRILLDKFTQTGSSPQYSLQSSS